MPRRARLSLPGFPGIFTTSVHPCTHGISTSLYIIQRGNNRTACFYADEDYHRDLDTLKEQADKYNCLIDAYILISNRVHLLITPEQEDSFSLLMKHLGSLADRLELNNRCLSLFTLVRNLMHMHH